MPFTFYIFLYCLFLFILGGDSKEKKFLYLVLTLPVLIFIHSFINPLTITDLPAYKEGFRDVSSFNIFNIKDIEIFQSFYKFEYGFIFLLKVVSLLTNDFVIFLCLSSCLYLGINSALFLRYSSNICVSILVLLVVFFDQSTFVLRQYLSIAVVMLSIPAVIDRKLVRFLIIMVVAFLLHKSSLIWAFIYFFYGVKKEWKIVLSLGLGTIALSVMCNNLSFLNNQFSLGYSSYIDGARSDHANYVQFFVSLSMFVVYIAVLKRKIWNEGINKLCTLSIFVLVVMSLIGTNIGILSRFVLVFETSLLFIIPKVYVSIKNRVMRTLYLFFSLGLYAYITYFGSFSKYMEKAHLLIPSLVQIFCYMVLTIIVFILLNKFMRLRNNESTNMVH